MAITDVKIKLPLIVTDSTATATCTMTHTGTNFDVQNDTGLIRMGNGVYSVSIDNVNGRLGVGTDTPIYGIHRYKTGANATIGAERASGAIAVFNARATEATTGSASNHPLWIITNNTSKVVIDTSGNVTIPAAVTTVISGAVDLYIGSDGTLGPNPSSRRFKENIRKTVKSDTDWIYRVEVKKYDMKPERGGEKDKLGLIAEEVETINPKLVRYGIHEVTEAGPVLLNQANYDLTAASQELTPNEEKDGVPVDRKAIDAAGNYTTIREWKKLALLPISVNLSDLIVPMLKEIQELNARLEKIEKKGG